MLERGDEHGGFADNDDEEDDPFFHHTGGDEDDDDDGGVFDLDDVMGEGWIGRGDQEHCEENEEKEEGREEA